MISTTAFSCGCKIGFGGDTCDVGKALDLAVIDVR